MQHWPAQLISILWILWALYWLIASGSVKAVQQREPLGSRLLFIVPMVITGVLLWIQRLSGPLSWLNQVVIGGGWTRYGIGVAFVVIGLGLACWARAILGGNWSGTVTVKVDHELVRTGPYRVIRHPIYTGLLLALLGTALASGRMKGLVAVGIAIIALWRKLRIEERYMNQEFGERYAEYRRTTWALLPYIW